MSAGQGFHTPHDSVVHRLPGHIKIVCSVAFTIAVVLTPREAFWAFGGYTAIVAVTALAARVRPGWLLTRTLIETPFVALVVLLPFTAGGAVTHVWGLELSVAGLYGAWNILAKATLGVWASLLLAATTSVSELLAGLDRLRFPTVMTQIAAFMVRYVHVLVGEAKRMRTARLSRGDDPRFLWQLKGYATGVGALFLRSYERGERVYLAMLSRGYTGRMPLAAGAPAGTARQWAAAGAVPVTAAAISALAILA